MKRFVNEKKEYDSMSIEKLGNELNELKALLEEVIEERQAVLWDTTGLHRQTSHIAARYEEEMKELNKCIDYIAGKV